MDRSNELRVFISSTFRDLQEEREHLVKKIFPEIRALCRQRGITFTEVDLRWGLTEEDVVLGQVIRTCLEEIDKCRPYFIGVIGNRYGWVPELHEVLMDPELSAKYPWIEDAALNGASLTEMEFIHGVFDTRQVDGEYAFFYHRSGEIAAADDLDRLTQLIERARNSGNPFREFTNLDELGRQVSADLLAMVNRYWPEREVPTPVELERRAHAAFASSRIRAYIPNVEYVKRFNAWERGSAIADPGLAGVHESSVPSPATYPQPRTPLVISAESGLGKSSLIAYLVDYYRRKNPTALVIEHYVGASPTSGSAVSLMRHLIEEMCARFGIDEAPPAKEEALRRSFADWLFRCEHLSSQAGIEVIIAIDAVNQLDESGRRLSWLPKTIPAGVKLVISTTPDETHDTLVERGWEILEVKPLDDERMRQSIVIRYLGEFHKGIAPEQVRRVTSDPKAVSPLYLRVVAEELRLHGQHETLDGAIDRYVGAADLLGLFDVVLERVERDYGASTVRDLLGAIGASRSGLSETELLEITGISRLDLSRLLLAFDYHLIQRDGLTGFFHDYLRRAVVNRYLNDAQRAEQLRRLARYFRAMPESGRSAGTLLWLYTQLDDVEALRALLGRLPILEILAGSGELFAMLGAWKVLMERGVDLVQTLRQGLADFCSADTSPEDVSSAYAMAGQLLGDLGAWDAVRETAEEALRRAESSEYLNGQARAEFTLASMCMDQGLYDEALQRLHRARQLHEQTGDDDAASAVLGELGIVYTYRDGIGDMARAMECYRDRLAAAEKRGDRRQIAGVLHNIGVVFMKEGRIHEALDHFERCMEINTSLGNLQWIMVNLSSIGEANTKQGRYDRAVEVHERVLKTAEKLGDRNKLITALAQIGLVNYESGDFDRALDNIRQAHTMFAEMGDRRKSTVTLGLIGDILNRQGDFAEALDCLEQALGAFREMGAHTNVAITLQNLAETLISIVLREPDASCTMPGFIATNIPGIDPENWQSMTLRRAWDYAAEVVEIAGQLQYGEALFDGRVLSARIDHLLYSSAEHFPVDNGDVASLPDPSQILRDMLPEAVNDQQRAELHYWLWALYADATSRDEAMRLYVTLMGSTPTFKFRKRLDDLASAAPSTEAPDATAE